MAEYCMKCMMPMGGGDVCPHCKDQGDFVTAPHRLQPGTVLHSRYLVGCAIGQGGFGITYMGRDLTLNIRVAIKEYYPNGYTNRNAAVSSEITITDKEQADFIGSGIKKFLSEARALAQFHENQGVVEVRDFFEENQTAYIVMEYLDGHDLRVYLKKNLFTADEIFELMQPVMDALEKIHAVGIVHRDISPDNIMLLRNGTVKLMDFGAARLLDLSDQRSVSVVLKAGYAPEEQYRPKGKQGPWTDIYALCATIYKCITGITPDDALERSHQDELQWPSELGVEISAVQEAVLKKGMAVEQEDRFQNIQEMKAMLERKPKVHAVEFDDDDEATVYLGDRGKMSGGGNAEAMKASGGSGTRVESAAGGECVDASVRKNSAESRKNEEVKTGAQKNEGDESRNAGAVSGGQVKTSAGNCVKTEAENSAGNSAEAGVGNRAGKSAETGAENRVGKSAETGAENSVGKSAETGAENRAGKSAETGTENCVEKKKENNPEEANGKKGMSPAIGVGLAVAAVAVIGGLAMFGGNEGSGTETDPAGGTASAVETTLHAGSSGPAGESAGLGATKESINGAEVGNGTGSYLADEATVEFENGDYVHIVLNAHEDISVKGYNAALEILKERLDIFTEGETYYMNAEAHAVELYLPEQAFYDHNVSNVLRCYLTRPMELYAYDGQGTVGYNPQKVAIRQDEIESTERMHGAIPGINPADYGVEADEYPYVKLVLSDACVERYQSKLGVEDGNIVFALDMSFDDYFYYHTISAGDGKTFYLLNKDMEGPFIDLMMYNLTGEHLEEGFTFWIDYGYKAQWEVVETEQMAGENQCNETELEGDVMTVLYTTSTAAWSKGEEIDVELAFKERLDALDQPYAFGWGEEDGKRIVAVKTGTGHIGQPIVNGLKEQFGVELRAGLLEEPLYPHSSSTLTAEKKDDGTYRATLQINAYDAEEKVEKLTEAVGEDGGEVILTVSGLPFLSAHVEKTMGGTALVFEETYLPEKGAITGENLWVVEFVESVLCGTELPLSFYYDQNHSSLFPGIFTDDESLSYGVSYDSFGTEIKEMLENALDMEPMVVVDGNTLKIQFDLSVDETLPEQALSLGRQVYELSDFENSSFEELIIYPIVENDEEKERLRVIFKKNFSGSETDQYSYVHGIFANGRLERYEEQFKALVETDEFYRKKTSANPYGGELWRFD